MKSSWKYKNAVKNLPAKDLKNFSAQWQTRRVDSLVGQRKTTELDLRRVIFVPTPDCWSRAVLKHDLIKQQAITWTFWNRQNIISSRSMFVISALFVLFFVLTIVHFTGTLKLSSFSYQVFPDAESFFELLPELRKDQSLF